MLTECREIYFKLKDKIFTGPRPYQPELFEKLLAKKLGNDKLIAVKPPPRVLVPSLNIKSYPGNLKFFRYESLLFLFYRHLDIRHMITVL